MECASQNTKGCMQRFGLDAWEHTRTHLHCYMEMSNRNESSSKEQSAMIIVLSDYRNNVLLDGSSNAKLGDFGLA